MPTNQQRRATAKRKLERQLERRAQRARKRRIWTIAGASVLAVAAVAGVVAAVVMTKEDSDTSAAATGAPTTPAQDAGLEGVQPLPPFKPPADLGANCTYPVSAQPAAKPVEKPRTGKIPTDPATISASMATTQGNIGLKLDNAKAPCTVNSFASLAQKGYFDNVPCHRLTTGQSGVLQCGDPSGSGSGGPGYQFANEYPTNQYRPDDPALGQEYVYPRGTLAMANAGVGTNGSQFFMVYKDTPLNPNYTVFGTIDETGLATLDKIAAAGVAGGGEDGRPATDVKITSVRLD